MGGRAAKVYCERCDAVFGSRRRFEEHLSRHSGTRCEACPVDTALSGLAGLLRRALGRDVE